MIIYVLLAAFIVGLAGGAGGMNWWHDSRDAARERDLAEAQAKVDELAAENRATYERGIANEAAAFVAGEANAKVIVQRTYERGRTYAATNAVIGNPQCFIPADGLQLISAARAGTEPPAVAAGSNGAVSGAGTSPGGPGGRGAVPVGNVPADPAGRSSGGGVPAPAGSASANGQVPAAGTRRVPTNPLKP